MHSWGVSILPSASRAARGTWLSQNCQERKAVEEENSIEEENSFYSLTASGECECFLLVCLSLSCCKGNGLVPRKLNCPHINDGVVVSLLKVALNGGTR